MESITLIRENQLLDSPLQRRRKLGDVTELASSIREVGILEPLIVRLHVPPEPVVDGDFAEVTTLYEIVCGHRRRAGGKLAELEVFPCIIRTLHDEEVITMQLIENGHRADEHPLDEARGYAELQQRGLGLDLIAERVGRSVAYVHQRMRLLEMSKKVQSALDESAITLPVALEIAKLPDKKLQEEALELVGGTEWEPPMKLADARKAIADEIMCRLDDKSGFDQADTKLVPSAGACTTCPYRTGNQRDLFASESTDLCTMPSCFKQKVEAGWKLAKKQHETEGRKVLEGKAATEALRHSNYSNGGGPFRDLTASYYVPGDSYKSKQISTLFGKKDLPPVTIARDENGTVHRLVSSADVKKAIAEKHPTKKKTADANADASAARERRKSKIQSLAVERTIEKAIARAGTLKHEDIVSLLVECLAAVSWHDVQAATLKRRGITFGNGAEPALVNAIDGMAAKDLAGLGIELALRKFSPRAHVGPSKRWTEVLNQLKVDYKAVLQEVTAQEAAERKAKAKKQPAPAKGNQAKAPAKKAAKKAKRGAK